MPQDEWAMSLLPQTDAVELMAAVLAEREGRPTFLKSFDPDGHGGYGSIEFTTEITEAKRFPSTSAVLEEWRRQSTIRPLRDDGKPNRPLTAYSCNPHRISTEQRP